MKYYIGIDLGGTNVRTLLVDETGKSYSEVKDATERDNGPDYVCSKIIRQIESLDCSVCGGLENVQGIGIGVPGPVDTEHGVYDHGLQIYLVLKTIQFVKSYLAVSIYQFLLIMMRMLLDSLKPYLGLVKGNQLVIM